MKSLKKFFKLYNFFLIVSNYSIPKISAYFLVVEKQLKNENIFLKNPFVFLKFINLLSAMYKYVILFHAKELISEVSVFTRIGQKLGDMKLGILQVLLFFLGFRNTSISITTHFHSSSYFHEPFFANIKRFFSNL